MKKLVLIISFLIVSLLVKAQSFPVQLIPQVVPPQSVYISDYSNTFTRTDRLRLQILLNDLTVTNREVRLKIYLEGEGITAESRDFVVGASSIFIDGGVPLQLGSVDLAPYFEFQNLQGINQNTYANTLPEGIYQFCFEIYDVLSGNRLSKKTCANSILFQNSPPFLVAPFNESVFEYQNITNILFQWTPRHINVTNVQYEITLVQIYDNYVDPQAAFLSSTPIFQQVVSTTSLLYDQSYPALLPGYKYAWRVRAFATSGADEISVFDNHGYSEIWSFTYIEPCNAPTALKEENLSIDYAQISWQGSQEHLDYKISYREKNANSSWYVINTPREYLTLNGLKPATTYQYKVGGNCDLGNFTYSPIKEFTTLANLHQRKSYVCDIPPGTIDLSNETLLTELLVNDLFFANDFPITVLELTNNSAPFTGKGYIGVPWLNFARIGVEFNGIQINDEFKMVGGFVQSTYDADWSNVDFIDDYIDLDDGENDVTEVDLDFEVDNIVIVNGEVIVTGTDGQVVTYPNVDDLVITDSNGTTYVIPANSEDTPEGTTISPVSIGTGGPINTNTTPGFTDGVLTQLSAEGVKVEFSKSSNSTYSFDKIPERFRNDLSLYYDKIKDSNGNNYDVVYKAIELNKTDEIIANITTDDVAKLDNLVFKTKSGILIPHTLSSDKTTATLTIDGLFNYEPSNVYATIVNPQNSTETIAGVFKAWHLTQKSVNVTLVPVNGAVIPSNVTSQLNAIYNKVSVNFSVTVASNFNIDSSVLGDNSIEVGNSGLLAHYTEDEKAIYNLYKSINTVEEEMFYVFVTDIPTSEPIAGFMKLKGKYGFIFKDNISDDTKIGKYVGHELGHGVFGLKHPYKAFQGIPVESRLPWLMEGLTEGTNFPQMSWKKIHNPSFEIYLFQDDDDGENVILSSYFRNLDFGENSYYDTFTFLTPTGESIDLPNNVESVEFYYGYFGSSEQGDFKQFLNFTPGTLKSFKIDNLVYKASVVFSDNNLATLNGYFATNENNEQVPYNNIERTSLSNKSRAIILRYNGSQFELAKMFWGEASIPFYTNQPKPLVSVIDFPMPSGTSAQVRRVSDYSDLASNINIITDEITTWAFRQVHYDSNAVYQVFLRNKIAELKAAFPSFIDFVTKSFDDWQLCNAAYDSNTRYFEAYLNYTYCNCTYEIDPMSGTDLSTCFEKPNLDSKPISEVDFLKEYIAYLGRAIEDENINTSNILEAIKDNIDYTNTVDINNLVRAVNFATTPDINSLDGEDIVRILARIVDEGVTEGNEARNREEAIIKLIEKTKNVEADAVITGLEATNYFNPSKYLYRQLFKKVDDKFLGFISGDNNRGRLINAFVMLSLNAVSRYETAIVDLIENFDNRHFILEYQNILKRALIQISINQTLGQIKRNELFQKWGKYYTIDVDYRGDEGLFDAEQNVQQGFSWPETLFEAEGLSPFDLVFFENRSNLSVIRAFEANNIINRDLPLPAIALMYADNASDGETTVQVIFTAIDIVSLATGAGEVLVAANKVRRALAIVDIAADLASLGITAASDTDSELIQELSQFTMIYSVLRLGVGGALKLGDISDLPTPPPVRGVLDDLDDLTSTQKIRLTNDKAAYIKMQYYLKRAESQAEGNLKDRITHKIDELKIAREIATDILPNTGRAITNSNNLLSIESIAGQFKSFKINGSSPRVQGRAGTFWNKGPNENIAHYVSNDAKLYLKHDTSTGEVLLFDVSKRKCIGYGLDEDNLFNNKFDGNYDRLMTNMKRLFGYDSNFSHIQMPDGRGNILLNQNKTNILLGKWRPDKSELVGEIGTDDVIYEMGLFKNHAYSDNVASIRPGSIHLLNVPEGSITTDFFEAFNREFLDFALTNRNAKEIIFLSDVTDISKKNLLRAYNPATQSLGDFPSGLAKEIKYLRDRGVTNVKLKDGSTINLNDVNLDFLNWSTWQY